MNTFRLATPLGSLLFTDEVLKQFRKSRQRWRWSKMTGGQLFARLTNSNTEVCKATRTRPKDRRGRFFFLPDREEENKEIQSCFLDGLHYVGDWHTHPQELPTPSQERLE